MIESSNAVNMQTPAAVLAPKQQYLNLIMNSIYKFSELCSSVETSKETYVKVSMLCRMTINYIPNPKERERLNILRNEKRAEALKIKDLDAQRDALFQVDCDIIGEIMSLMDDVLAIVERQSILGRVSTENSVITELEKEYYSEEKGECD